MSLKKYIVIITGFYIFWLGIIPFTLSKAVDIVCKNISHNSDYEIKIDNPKIKLYFIPIVRFGAESIICNDKKSSDSLSIDKISVKIRLLPLLTGKVHVNSFKTKDIILSKEIKKDTTLNKDFFQNINKTRLTLDSADIKTFNLRFLSDKTSSPIIYEGSDFNFNKTNRFLNMKVNSKLTSNNVPSKIFINLFIPKGNSIHNTRFDVDISNLNINPLGEFFKNFIPEEIDTLYGTINVSANNNELKTDLKNVQIINKTKEHSMIFPEEMSVKSKFNIKQNLITLNNADISSKNIHVSVSGKIKDYFGETTPDTDLKITINKSRVEDFVSMVPPFKVEEFDSYKLKKYKFYGDVIGNISITGKLPEPNLYGKVFIDNGILIKPIPNTSKGATVKIELTGRHANYDVNVPAGGSQVVWVKGIQELYNIKYGDVIVKSTPNVNLRSAEDVVNPLHEILNFVIGPVPILDVHGTGNIDLIVKGNRTNPHAWGTLNFYNADVNFTEIPDLKLIGTDAVLTFDDEKASFVTKKGKVNNKDFGISGTCDLSGHFDFDVNSQNQPTFNLYHAIQTSTMIDDIKKMIPKVDKISGTSDLKLKIYGSVKNIEDLKFNKNAFAKGIVNLRNNEIMFQGTELNNTNAEIKVDGTSAIAIINAFISNSPVNINAKVKNNIADLTANIPKFNLNTLIQDTSTKEQNYLPYVSLYTKYKGDINNVEYDKITLNASIIPQNDNKLFNFISGQVFLNNGKLTVKNLDFNIKDLNNNVKADLQISNTFSKNPVLNGLLKIKIADVKILNEIFGKKILPDSLNNLLKDYEFETGAINFNARFNDGKLSTESNLGDIKFNYIPLEIPIEIINGKLIAHNNNLRLKSINILADKMPILLDGEIKDFCNEQNFNIYINSKPQQDFIDKVLNKNAIYPLKIKGDIIFNATIKGIINDYDIDSKISMAKDSSIYYYGATIGDLENAIELSLNSKIRNKKFIKIKDFTYNKIITSQSGKQTSLNMLKVKGGLNLLKDDIEFKDLYIKTSNPTDIRIFNIIFGKPNIKQGQFTSDLKMRGKLSEPKIFGNFRIVETDIPFLDTTMKNIELLFKDKLLEIYSKGEVFGNDVTVEAVLQNKLTKPYCIEKALITTKEINLNDLINKLKTAEAENEKTQDNNWNPDLNLIIAKNLKLLADKVILRNMHAANFEAETSLNEQRIVEIKDFKFDIAQGSLRGKYSYNLKNNQMNINMNADNINANDITLAIFDLQNQIYGDLTGTIDLSCNGNNFEKCMQTLNGSTVFNVKDGRMPKLGSLEYLLKAGNLVKGGITGLSVNSLIDLITPIKTGEFSDIYGSIYIKDGIAENIEITTQGKDLNLFIGGTYNFYTSIAEMEVLGMLSRKISTMLGPVGNLSLNTLFNLIPGVDLSKDTNLRENINKIPGIEISSKAYRKFVAEIMGNINGENYVTSFKWIN